MLQRGRKRPLERPVFSAENTVKLNPYRRKGRLNGFPPPYGPRPDDDSNPLNAGLIDEALIHLIGDDERIRSNRLVQETAGAVGGHVKRKLPPARSERLLAGHAAGHVKSRSAFRLRPHKRINKHRVAGAVDRLDPSLRTIKALVHRKGKHVHPLVTQSSLHQMKPLLSE